MLVHIPNDIVILVLLLAFFGADLTIQCDQGSWQEQLEKLHQCCQVPKVEMGSEAIVAKCTEILGNWPKVKNNTRKYDNCISDCIFRESKYVTDDWEFDIEAINQNFRRSLPNDDQWPEVFIDATNTCLTNKNKNLKELLKNKAEKIKDTPCLCNPVPNQLIKCTQNQVYSACPVNARNSSEECSKLFKKKQERGERRAQRNGKNKGGSATTSTMATTT